MACCPRLAPLRSPASVCVIEPTWAISENACLSKSPRQAAPGQTTTELRIASHRLDVCYPFSEHGEL